MFFLEESTLVQCYVKCQYDVLVMELFFTEFLASVIVGLTQAIIVVKHEHRDVAALCVSSVRLES